MSEWKVETSEYVPLDLGVEYAAEGAPFPVPRPDLLTEWLNKKAADGWMLIAVDSGIYYFERKARQLREEVEMNEQEEIDRHLEATKCGIYSTRLLSDLLVRTQTSDSPCDILR